MNRRGFIAALTAFLAARPVWSKKAEESYSYTNLPVIDWLENPAAQLGPSYFRLDWDKLMFLGLDVEADDPNILNMIFYVRDKQSEYDLQWYCDHLHRYQSGVLVEVVGGQFGEEGVKARCLKFERHKGFLHPPMPLSVGISELHTRPTIFEMQLEYIDDD